MQGTIRGTFRSGHEKTSASVEPFAEVFKSSGGHVIAPLASHDAEEGRNACTLLALFASLFQLVLMAGNSINKSRSFCVA